jgi:ribonuclease HII
LPLWAGIDEAGYGPQVGPLVVAATAFHVPETPERGFLWKALRDAVCRSVKTMDGRVMVDDSKLVYSGDGGLKRLEEGVLSFAYAPGGPAPRRAADLTEWTCGGRPAVEPLKPWFEDVPAFELPLVSNLSAVESKALLLELAMREETVQLAGARACVVHAPEYNRVCKATLNKSMLLWQKCGLLLQELWNVAGPGESHVLVDKHGGRAFYRDLLRDVFPDAQIDVLVEGAEDSTYRVREGEKSMVASFVPEGDSKAMPTALASMVAKYTREIHMKAFNDYWCGRLPELKPTAGYFGDGRRFVKEIEHLLEADGIPTEHVLRRNWNYVND